MFARSCIRSTFWSSAAFALSFVFFQLSRARAAKLWDCVTWSEEVVKIIGCDLRSRNTAGEEKSMKCQPSDNFTRLIASSASPSHHSLCTNYAEKTTTAEIQFITCVAFYANMPCDSDDDAVEFHRKLSQIYLLGCSPSCLRRVNSDGRARVKKRDMMRKNPFLELIVTPSAFFFCDHWNHWRRSTKSAICIIN